MKTLLAVLALCVSMFFGVGIPSAFAQQTASVDKPTLEVGQTWTFARTDLWKNQVTRRRVQTVTEVLSGAYTVQYRDNGGQAVGTIELTDQLDEHKIDGQKSGFMRPVVFPLSVGKTWESTAGLGGLSTKQKCKVEAFEPVTVKAGTFSAYKIVCPGSYNNSGNSGSTMTVRYYAPEIGRPIRIEFSDRTPSGTVWNNWVDELVSFTPATPAQKKTAQAQVAQ